MTPVYDGEWRLFRYDPASGCQIWVIWENGRIKHARIDYVVENIVRINAEERAESAGKRHREWERIASMPLNFFYASGVAEAMAQGDRKYYAKVLNDPDNRAWRTKESKI